jgi:hypothetical protein
MVPARLLASACFALALCAGPFAAAWSQPAGIPGFLDPQTGRFIVRPVAAESDRANTTYTGTVKLVFAITIKSAIPTSTAIKCTAIIDAHDQAFTQQYTETATVTATRSGTSAACTVPVPYQWTLGTGATYGAGYTVVAGALRSSTLDFPNATTAIGAQGSTNTINYNVTL